MPQISENFAELVDLDPVLTEIFYQHYTQVAPIRSLLFGMRNSNKANETDQRIGSFSDPVEFAGRVEYTRAEADYEVVYSHTEFARGFIVERKMLDDMQYDGIFDNAGGMGTAFGRKQEKDAAGVFNNAFATVTGYDSKTLCSTTHTRSESDSTAVINYLTLQLNSDNLETAITTLEGLGDDLGEEISIKGDILLVPRALRKKALELTESELTPESANNATNVHQGLQTVVWPFLTDNNAWFVIDSTLASQYLKWYTRIPVEFAAEDDFDTLMRKFRGYMRYSYGWSDFRFLVGSNPS